MTDILGRFKEMWDEQLSAELEDERSGDYQPDQFYRSGRASKAFPNKEDPSWWAEKGPEFVGMWETWRDASDLDIWTTPDIHATECPGLFYEECEERAGCYPSTPAIEIKVEAQRGTEKLLCYIDRVMVDEHDRLYIVDLKTGSQTPAWPRQLALNNLGLLHTFGVWATYGGFWSARKGGIDPGWSDLRIYTEEWLWEQVRVAREIRDQQLFAAQPGNLCNSACGVAPYCKAVGGPLSLLLDDDATMTQDRKVQG